MSDHGTIECTGSDCLARVTDVYRLGDDQALAVVLERGALQADQPVVARVDHAARRATERNHTATHLLHAALRERLGEHVRQAGSYVGPDKLRFDFTHSGALSEQELRDVEDAVNARIADGEPGASDLDDARRGKAAGAMALFGEKYGEVVRMVQIGDGSYSRELCGGTHVRSTAEIGAFLITSETSSAANVRRIEALTGAAAVERLRAHDRLLSEAAGELRARPEDVARAARARGQELKELGARQLRRGRRADRHRGAGRPRAGRGRRAGPHGDGRARRRQGAAGDPRPAARAARYGGDRARQRAGRSRASGGGCRPRARGARREGRGDRQDGRRRPSAEAAGGANRRPGGRARPRAPWTRR